MTWLSVLIFIGVAICILQLVHIEYHRPKTTTELLASITVRMMTAEKAIAMLDMNCRMTRAQVEQFKVAWGSYTASTRLASCVARWLYYAVWYS